MIKKIKYLFLLIFGIILFYPKDTFAVTNLVGNSGTMGYYINGNYGRNVNWSGNFPVELLTSYSGYYKYLYGLESTFTFTDIYSGNYVNNGVYTYIQVHRGGSQGVLDWNQSIPLHYNAISNTGIEKNGTCSVDSANNQYITYKCQVDYTNNAYPSRVTMIIGQTANFTYDNTPYLGRTMLTDDTSSLYLQAMYFNAYSSNNDEPGGGDSSSVDLTDTNNKIDDVNNSVQDVKDSVDDINDTLIDDSVPSDRDFVGFTENLNSYIITNPLGTLMTLPLRFVSTMYGQFSTGADDGCYPVKLITFSWIVDEPYDVYLPCFNGEDYFGSLWDVIDYLMCFYMFYNIVILFIHVYEDIATLSIGTSTNAATTGSSSTSPYGRMKH